MESSSTLALVGTYSGDIQTLSEMIEDGFEKKEATKSLRAIGKCLELSAATIRDKLKR